MGIDDIMGSLTEKQYQLFTHAAGPSGKLPLTPEMLLHSPSGDLFGLSQNVGMGWKPSKLLGKQMLILGTQGGIKDELGQPIALGYHTGHWEISDLMKSVANEINESGGIPFAGFVSDPCDGRSQGTTGMFDSLPYRNDAAIVLRRLIRSLPQRAAVIGVGTCDKGLPAMMLAIAGSPQLPGIIVPGGVTLPPTSGEDAGKIQTIGARYANGDLSLEEAADLGCRACATPGGGCQFLGTAGTAQVIAEAMGLTVPHAALAPSGQEIWHEMARQSARAAIHMASSGLKTKDILTDDAIYNGMVVHAAFGGSTNLLLHIPAIAHAAGLRIPTVQEWAEVNRKVPRLVSVLPNGPHPHTTVRAFLAGGVPEVMLHLRKLGVLREHALTVTGQTIGEVLDWWEKSERRVVMKQTLIKLDGVQPEEVIFAPEQAKLAGLTSTVTFPLGNIAPEGSVIKSTAIDPSKVSAAGIFHHVGRAKVFTTERAAIAAIKNKGIEAGDVLVLIGRGPSGTGMEETYQLTSALKHLPFGKDVALITDARFSGVSTGACIGHIGPEALAGGPVGKLRTGDWIDIHIQLHTLEGSIHMLGDGEAPTNFDEGTAILAQREMHSELRADPDLPDDTKLWAALQAASGGTWRGCIYDVERIKAFLDIGMRSEEGQQLLQSYLESDGGS
ncbi:putative YjhG/YagF family dehydratase [Paenibacillus endophyticus]|uniref:Putative YjhG/YagF family dehydratase n=1 Tax=Paenibacillus endophyticus TaxID=1294268 RepID=A0A7W5GDG8_9BACL|nr:YjhG/YagF family D-xylonate dehydratase [Paenibacillus endophyticus]MBB3155921.1 putative YjhG/YagF family dehydratase [Paenibacillus endophyticus]